MLSIYVLEDDFLQQTRLENAIAEFIKESGKNYRRLEIFGKPQQLLDAISEKGNHNLFFLDIEIKGEEQKGMEIAREIRLRDAHANIVFVTTHSEFMPVTYRYRVSALDFIDKGLSGEAFQETVSSVLSYAFDNVNQTVASDSFNFKTDQAHVQVPFSDILYFETSPTVHKVILHTKDGQLEFYGKVSEIAKADERLYQSHRAFVVNPQNITRLDKKTNTVYFSEDETCFVSRMKVKGLIERLSD
ncbi:response regulator transcription factor [Streptococcus loxodontisalivarius]|uniref:Two-component system response regulator AgrA n=1 Tax=Streptococcus loxodontisalivarius TaxID=1349415 RepID=A0ABS2PTM1_9STRE|nr:response regulator transcription factor [Streptococcus loxodontisalivarius]MBM7643355.1 two-component system response regulator AgrA [Streptococcus loxodontisalivarius]